MTFDIDGARKAGYSDQEIADHLASKSKFDAAGARKSGYSDAEIIDHLSKKQTEQPKPVEPVDPANEWLAKYRAHQAPYADLLKNIPSSGLRFIGGLANTVMHPVDSAKNLLDIGAGGLRNITPKGLSDLIDKADPNPQAAERASEMANMVGRAYKERYGGLENIKKTIVEDPVGAAADISTLLGVGGAMLGVGGGAMHTGQVGSALSTASKAMSAASKYTNPLSVIPPAVEAAVNGSKWAANTLMHSAIKPTLNEFRKANVDEAIQTMLDKGVSPTRGGVEKLRGMIDEKNQQIQGAISNSKATINPDDVLAYLGETERRFANQVAPQADLNTIGSVGRDFQRHPMITGNIPVQEAQNIKQGTYHILRDKYGQIGTAETEAQKALARGLKEEIAAKVPGVSLLNAEEGRLLNALDIAERRALLELNKNPIGLSLLSSNKARMAIYMADKSALFKSLVARMINRTGGLLESVSDASSPYSGLLKSLGLGAAQSGAVQGLLSETNNVGPN